jgi:hypothetical protein
MISQLINLILTACGIIVLAATVIVAQGDWISLSIAGFMIGYGSFFLIAEHNKQKSIGNQPND